jgi:hypothetical protein
VLNPGVLPAVSPGETCPRGLPFVAPSLVKTELMSAVPEQTVASRRIAPALVFGTFMPVVVALRKAPVAAVSSTAGLNSQIAAPSPIADEKLTVTPIIPAGTFWAIQKSPPHVPPVNATPGTCAKVAPEAVTLVTVPLPANPPDATSVEPAVVDVTVTVIDDELATPLEATLRSVTVPTSASSEAPVDPAGHGATCNVGEVASPDNRFSEKGADDTDPPPTQVAGLVGLGQLAFALTDITMV